MARIVKFAVPGVVGVPLNSPVDAFSDRPAGSEPALTLQVAVPTPPDCVNVWL